MLVDNLKVLLASSFSLYLKAANFHWNIEGPDFPQYHELFGKIASDSYASIDTIAEYIRVLGEYTPSSFTEYSSASLIDSHGGQPTTPNKILELTDNNTTLLEYLNQTFALATEEKQQGIASFMATRIDEIQKHNWMLRSTGKV